MKKEILEKSKKAEIGNTKTSASQDTQCMRWFFTLNNYTKEELEGLEKYFNEFCSKVIVGFEVGESGTPHLQGFFTVIKKCRFTEFKNMEWLKRARIEKCKNDKASMIYCQKDNNIFYKKGHIKKPLKVISELKPFQKDIEKMLMNEPNDRDVIWIYEETGNIGKSSLIKYMISKHDMVAGFCDGGKKTDVINMVFNLKDDPDIIFIDLPRENKGKISYKAVESLKNGMIFNSKFEAGFKMFNPPHVIIFSNSYPQDKELLSNDRWKIYKIKNEELVPQIVE